MFLIEVVPLTKIPIQKPQILSYFYAQPLAEGCLVLIPLARRQEKAIVVEAHEIKNHKLEIKEAEFQLRPIKKIINPGPVLTVNQIKLALWLGHYYFTSPGLFAKLMMPRKIPNSKFQIPNKSQIPNSKAQTLILVPEISQIRTEQKKYDQDKTAIVHSGLTSKHLSENWQKIAQGQAEIIIGTRLAIFTPFIKLEEIIIKDEANPHHRSWDMFPHYRTCAVAQKLREIFDAKILLEGELLSVESFYLNQSGDVGRPKLKTEIIDLRQELKQGNFSIFSRRLQQLINKALQNHQQIILFINRRGAATFVLCRDCGYVAKCPNCDAPLTYHFKKNSTGLKPILVCHHCNHQSPPPTLCPACQSHRLKAFGSGTQRVEIEAKKLFKNASVLRLDTDLAPSPEIQEKIIDQFKQKRADILIGTQMILNESASWRTKVPLVAVISADTLMHLPDFRSDEQLFQTINQLKKFTSSQLIIQTYNPKNTTLALAAGGDFQSFYQQEIATRKILKYPPFSQLIKLTFRHKDPKRAAAEAKILFSKLTQQLNSSKISKEVILEIIGPAPAFISKEKQKYIWQIIIKAKPVWLLKESERQNLINIRNKFLMTLPQAWEIDIDPETLL